MRLSDLIPAGVKGIGIIGMSKNAGKTTLFNRLLQEFEERGERVGVASAGVDGEKVDVWTGLPKPPIHPYPGTFVVTALQAIQEGTARFRLIKRIHGSAIGQEIYLAETVSKGGVKLIGTPSVRLLHRAVSAFRGAGATYHLIDGAYNRIASANPALVDGIFLAVGAASGPSLDFVAERVNEWLIPYRLPIEPTEEGADSLTAAAAPPYPKTVFVRGALTSQMLTHFMGNHPIPRVVIQDPTRWFVSREVFLRYRRIGGEVRLLRRPPLLGIGVNPYAPGEERWNGEEMMTRLREIAPELPIFDVVRDRILE